VVGGKAPAVRWLDGSDDGGRRRMRVAAVRPGSRLEAYPEQGQPGIMGGMA
jgi:hypothetical protein